MPRSAIESYPARLRPEIAVLETSGISQLFALGVDREGDKRTVRPTLRNDGSWPATGNHGRKIASSLPSRFADGRLRHCQACSWSCPP